MPTLQPRWPTCWSFCVSEGAPCDLNSRRGEGTNAAHGRRVYCRYRTIPERLLGQRLVHSQDDVSRVVSLDFMNRQLLWRELSDLLLFILPLLNGLSLRCATSCCSRIPRVRSTLTRVSACVPPCHVCRRISSVLSKPSSAGVTQDAHCPLCSQHVLLPFAAVPCGHVCCYVCLSASCRAHPQHDCHVCGTKITAVQRV
jgi:peroxin-2